MILEQKAITSLEVAEMVEKDHKNILRDIKGYMDEMSQLKIEPSDYFTESVYEKRGKEYPCYLVTKNGCEFIGHKLTSIKGTEFTTKYIERFHKMEEVISTGLEGLSTEMRALIMHDKKIQAVVEHMQSTDDRMDKLENEVPLFNIECDELQSLVKKVGTRCLGGYNSPAYKDNSLRAKVYKDIQNQLKREFGLERSYKALKRKQLDKAKEIIEAYELPFVLYEEVLDANHQLVLMLKEEK